MVVYMMRSTMHGVGLCSIYTQTFRCATQKGVVSGSGSGGRVKAVLITVDCLMCY